MPTVKAEFLFFTVVSINCKKIKFVLLSLVKSYGGRRLSCIFTSLFFPDFYSFTLAFLPSHVFIRLELGCESSVIKLPNANGYAC